MFGLKAIGSVFGKMLGTDKAFESGLNALSAGLDKLHYGKQEQAEHQMQRDNMVQNFILKWQEATSGQNVARRLIALPVVYTWLLMFMFMAGCVVASVWVPNPVEVLSPTGQVVKVNGLLEAAERLKPYAVEMKEIVYIVVIFYFGPHILGKAQDLFGKKDTPKK